jgi:glucokinase
MSHARHVYIGTDGGATTSKIGGVWSDGSTVSTRLLQRPTNAHLGPDACVRGWVESVGIYLAENDLTWGQVQGVGVAIAGPQQRYGVMDKGPNFPASFVGYDVLHHYGAALAASAGRPIPLVVGNDGNMGGVAEAQRVRGGAGTSTVVMLAPGSGLGCAFVDRHGLPLDGDTLAGMEASHMPAPLHLLDVDAWPCGCGRTWGCVEMYTSLAGLPRLLERTLARHPTHELATSTLPMKERAFALRSLAQQGDALATEIFDFQARAMGYFTAMLAMALDPEFLVIGGGLMDPDATTEEFRARYLRILRETALPYLWGAQRQRLTVVPAALGDLSQAIGAALVALYSRREAAADAANH